ncbi:MAG TPA: HlyD family efflux transporter periplasmic adaptor subunit [Vicinamibacteria bacterium]|nr:HlyD family efflux transporter periplasmic adaptor subunit [Vicinamibacteria bacterium]
MKRTLKIALAAAIAASALYLLVRPQPIEVETDFVSRGLLRITVDEEGRTRVHDHFLLAAPVAGKLVRIELHEGDRVQPDAVLARLQPVPLDERARSQAEARLAAAIAAKQAADARWKQAQANLDQAARTRERTDSLAAEGLKSARDQEEDRLRETTASRELEAAEFAVQVARYEVEAARAALLDGGRIAPDGDAGGPDTAVRAIRSPVSGRVFRIFTRSEQVVAAGTPLLEIGDTSALEVVVDVLSSDAVRVKPGAMMLIEDWGGEEALVARVRTVEPSAFTKVSALGVEEQRVNVIGDFLNPPERLGDGYRVEARIVIWEGEDVVKVPTSALFRSGDTWAVFVVENGTARLRHVEIGHRNFRESQVLDGLAEGEECVLYPSDQLGDGVVVARIRPMSG